MVWGSARQGPQTPNAQANFPVVCKVEQSTADAIWPALLESKKIADSSSTDAVAGITLFQSSGKWGATVAPEDLEDKKANGDVTVFARLDTETPVPSCATHTFSQDRFRSGDEPLQACGGAALHPRIHAILRMYLPLIMGSWHARRHGQAFVSAHVAQTLDGRIACQNGHSQWISNDANLKHAHRLRALHDVALIGSQTVTTDDPMLTVRHVKGEDPTRVILSGRGRAAALIGERKIFEEPGCLILCGANALTDFQPDEAGQHVEVCRLPSLESGPLPVAEVLEALNKRGLHSIFVEGGSMTLSSFLEHRRIDALHIHVAPRILGSGIPSFALPPVSDIQNSLPLKVEHFEMDNEPLFECRLGGER